MDDEDMTAVIGLILVALGIVAAIGLGYMNWTGQRECNRSGGVYVKQPIGFQNFVCIYPVLREPGRKRQ